MTDPIAHPIPSEDFVYGDAGPLKHNATSPKEDRIRAIERQRMRERNELLTVLSTEAGQAVIMRILTHCRPYHSTLDPEPTKYAAAEGRRTVGLWMLDLIAHADPELYPKLLLQHLKRQRDLAALETGIQQAV